MIRWLFLRCAAASGVMALVLLIVGCLRLEAPHPPKTSYLLSAQRNAATTATPTKRVLQVDPFESAPCCLGRRFVYRSGDQVWLNDYYHEFFTAPPAMLTEISRQWMQQSGLFDQVVATGFPPPSHLLRGRIVNLHGDYRPGRTPEAVLELEFSLWSLRGGAPVEPLQQSYHRRLALTDRRPESLVQAWSEALAEILAELETTLRQRFAADAGAVFPTPPPPASRSDQSAF